MTQNDVPLEQAGKARGYWTRLLLVAAITAILVSVLVFPFPWHSRAWSEVFNLAHAPSFLVAFLFIAALFDPCSIGLPRSWYRILSLNFRRLISLGVLVLMVGTVCEFLQQFVGRSSSLRDIMANGSGVVAGLFWCLGRRCVGGGRAAFPVAAICLLIAATWSPVAELHECRLQRQSLPLLASFERPRELNAWLAHESRATRTTAWKSHGVAAMQIEGTAGATFPGATFWWPTVDCRDYKVIELDVWNPGAKALTLRINIADYVHSVSGFDPNDRFKSSFEIPPVKEIHIRIDLAEIEKAPKTRTMNLTNLDHMNLFVVRPATDFTLMIDHVRLVKD